MGALETIWPPFTSWKKSLGVEKNKKESFEGGIYDYNYSEWWHLSRDTRKMRKDTGRSACLCACGEGGWIPDGEHRSDKGSEPCIALIYWERSWMWLMWWDRVLRGESICGSFWGLLFPFWVSRKLPEDSKPTSDMRHSTHAPSFICGLRTWRKQDKKN